ncbi:MAG: [LysW]-aminoadipate kinase [Chloroflexota bacterium]
MQPIVVKLGGSAGIDHNRTLDDLAQLWPDRNVIFIHGANAELDEFIRAQGREPQFVTSSKGQVSRFTDEQAMDDMLAVYTGKVNKRLVEGLQKRGVNAVGISALDGGIARGKRQSAIRIVEDGKSRMLRGDFAGSIRAIDTTLLDTLLNAGFMPVLTPPAISEDGEAINVDGDKLALQVAITVQAEALVLLSNTAGLLADVDDPSSLIAQVKVGDPESVEAATNAAVGRMKKKVESGLKAVEAGIQTVIFADARIENPISQALAGQGTALVSSPVTVTN